MRIVIDTNIWISAIATEGRISKWLNNICQNKDIIIILSTSILAEIKATLKNDNRNRRKKKKRKCFTEEHRKKFEAILNKATFEIIESKPIEGLDIFIFEMKMTFMLSKRQLMEKLIFLLVAIKILKKWKLHSSK